jgi:hypothetical protein
VTSVTTGTGPGCSDLDLRWSATDAGAGIQDVQLFISDDGGPYRLALVQSGETSTTLPGRPGHTYRLYTVARDAAGNSEAAPGAPDAVQPVAACAVTPMPAPTGPAIVTDRVAPTVTARLTNARFRLGRGRTAITAARARVGTTFRITLSEPAAFAIRISRVTTGVKKGKRCVKRTKKTRKGKRCALLTTRGTLTRRAGKQGRNNVKFSGRIGRKALSRGRHQAEIVATDAAGNRSRPKRLAFTIVR